MKKNAEAVSAVVMVVDIRAYSDSCRSMNRTRFLCTWKVNNE